jgi:hypothetical protein
LKSLSYFLAIALGCGTFQAAASAQTTLWAVPHYEAATGALVVPFCGDFPKVFADSYDVPPRIYVDVERADTALQAVRQQVQGDPLITEWEMVAQAEHLVRITLVLTRASTLKVRVDAKRKELRLIPTAGKQGPTGQPFRQIFGRTQFELGVVPLPPNAQEELDIALKTGRPTNMEIHSDPASDNFSFKINLGPPASPGPPPASAPTPLPTPTPLPMPSQATVIPIPTALPTFAPTAVPTFAPSNAPVLVPTALPTTQPTSPPASPAPTPPEQTSGTIPVGGGFNFLLASYQENYAAGSVGTHVDGVPIFGLSLETAWPRDWFEHLELGATTYGFEDRFLPLSVHARQNWHGDLAGYRRFTYSTLDLELGLGYQGLYEIGTHSGAPPAPSYAFTPSRIIHGPQLASRLFWHLGFGVGLFANATYAPYLFSSLPADIPALPQLMALGLDAGVAADFGPLRATLSYRRNNTSGTGYDETFQGPAISLQLQPGRY